jgi:hypothetical protein
MMMMMMPQGFHVGWSENEVLYAQKWQLLFGK